MPLELEMTEEAFFSYANSAWDKGEKLRLQSLLDEAKLVKQVGDRLEDV